MQPNLDFGDAPDPAYPTLLASDGARHIVLSTNFFPYLGHQPPDTEDDGKPSSDATGDNHEEGVIWSGDLEAGRPYALTVIAAGSGILNAWIDWNRDGNWSDPGEQILTNVTTANETNTFILDVPATFVSGQTFARFRISSEADLAPTGLARDGEVEDYAVVLDYPPVADLNGAQPGGDADLTFTEQTPVLIASAGTVADPDSLIQKMTVTLLARPDGDLVEWLSLNPVPAGLSTNYNSASGVLEISGAASDSVYQTALRQLYYNNSSENPNTDTRSILVQVQSANGATNDPVSATVHLDLVNNPPTISAVANQTINEDTSTGPLTFVIGDAETPPQNLSVSATSGDLTRVPAVNIVLGGSGATRTVSVIPAANQNGLATITLTVSDGELTAETSFTVTVNPVNDAPTITRLEDETVNEDTSTGLLAFTLTDIDTLPTDLTVTAISSDTTLIPPGNIVLGGSGANRTVTVTPASDQSGGPVAITLTVSDGTLTSATTFNVTVNPVNDPPTLANIANLTINEDAGVQTVNLSGISAGGGEAQTLTITAISGNVSLIPNPTVTYTSPNTTGSLSYTPVADASGTALITVTVNDGGASNNITTRTFTITVNPVNDLPTLGGLANLTINEDAGLQTVNLSSISAGGGESQVLTVSAGSSNPALIANPTVHYTSPNSAGTLTFTPAVNQSGTSLITVAVRDAGLDGIAGNEDDGITTATFTVTVNAGNDPPVANPQSVSLNEDGSVLIALTGDDGDPEIVQTLIFAITSGPAHGVISDFGSGTGVLRYTPALDYVGSDSFQFTVMDDSAAGVPANLTSIPATVSISVIAAVDTPGVTPSATREGEQTTFGLVITPHSGDQISTHFKLDHILNGLRFQNDGTTPITNGSLITLAQGAAGLRFTPTPGLYSPNTNFDFEVRAATDAKGTNLRAAAVGSILVLPHLDFGDAPGGYPTLLAEDGARHIVLTTGSTVYLGTVPPDTETNGLPSVEAEGDDTSGEDDEDGITLPSNITRNQSYIITVVANGGGYLNGWIDWNRTVELV